MADALGVAPGDITRTSGCELEFLVTSEDEGAFRTRLNKLADGGYKARYNKNPDFMPVALQPATWQKNLEMERAAAGNSKTDSHHIAGLIEQFTMEPSNYMPSIGVEHIGTDPLADNFRAIDKDHIVPRAYLTAEVVSTPTTPPETTAEWLSGIGQYLLDDLESKHQRAYLDFRAKPTTASWSNSVHIHTGMRISLTALLNSPKFSDEQKAKMLERNTRFYWEKLEKKGEDITICLGIEKACADGANVKSILGNERYASVINNITVNMFSKRELETDTVTIDDEDISAQSARMLVNTEIPREVMVNGKASAPRILQQADKGKTRIVGTDEISQFGLMFASTLERFNHECALMIAPAESSYQRFSYFNSFGAPTFNGAGQRKTVGAMGSYLFRGDGRISYGQYNKNGIPDTGDLRVENRVLCPEAIGHPNHAYPNQRAMPYELMEGIEAVFAKASQRYAQYLQGKEAPIPESALFDTYGRCVQELPKGQLPETVIPEAQQLPRNKDEAIQKFLAQQGMAEEIYGRDRLADMIARRKELDQIITADFHHFNDNPGPQNAHTQLRDIGIQVNDTQPHKGGQARL